MAELKYIPFYPGYMEDTSDLSDGEFRRLMYALCAYCEGAERPEPLTGKEAGRAGAFYRDRRTGFARACRSEHRADRCQQHDCDGTR